MSEQYNIQIVKSRRKTISLQLKPDGAILVKAPNRVSNRYIREFIASHQGWIENQFQKMEQVREAAGEPLTEAEIKELYEKAAKLIPERVAYYAAKIGVTYGRITIRKQKTRWGSCSSRGNLNFNCLLMLTPDKAIDSVIVHELCHRKEMNHSPKFYEEVLKVFPEYYTWDHWLKKNGTAILLKGR